MAAVRLTEDDLALTDGPPVWRVSVIPFDAFGLARRIATEGHRVAILGNAHNEIPGGLARRMGGVFGASLDGSFEGELFARTDLGEIQLPDLYPIDRGAPGVLVASGVALANVRVAVLSHVIDRLPEVRWDDAAGAFVYRHEADTVATLAKLRMALRAAVRAQVDILIVALWDSETAFFPMEELCSLWKAAFASAPGPRHLVFSVPGLAARALHRAAFPRQK